MAAKLNEHDSVIEHLARNAPFGMVAHTNPGPQKNFKFASFYPDVVWLRRSNEQQGVMFEVERDAKVTKAEAVQWRKYLKHAEVVHLVVPHMSLDKAIKLCEAEKLHGLRIGTYGLNFLGRVEVKLERHICKDAAVLRGRATGIKWF